MLLSVPCYFLLAFNVVRLTFFSCLLLHSRSPPFLFFCTPLSWALPVVQIWLYSPKLLFDLHFLIHSPVWAVCSGTNFWFDPFFPWEQYLHPVTVYRLQYSQSCSISAVSDFNCNMELSLNIIISELRYVVQFLPPLLSLLALYNFCFTLANPRWWSLLPSAPVIHHSGVKKIISTSCLSAFNCILFAAARKLYPKRSLLALLLYWLVHTALLL